MELDGVSEVAYVADEVQLLLNFYLFVLSELVRGPVIIMSLWVVTRCVIAVTFFFLFGLFGDSFLFSLEKILGSGDVYTVPLILFREFWP